MQGKLSSVFPCAAVLERALRDKLHLSPALLSNARSGSVGTEVESFEWERKTHPFCLKSYVKATYGTVVVFQHSSTNEPLPYKCEIDAIDFSFSLRLDDAC